MGFIRYVLCFMFLNVSLLFSNDNLIKYEVINYEILEPLTNIAGDPDRGKIVASSRKGNCLACHILPDVNEPFHGNVGPSLEGVGNRYTINELRLRIVNPYIINPDTVMPAFYKIDGLDRVDKNFIGKPILDEQEIEDLLSWLITLKKD